METEVISVSSSEMLEAINKSEVDVQIATAHRFPRNIEKCRENMLQLATMDDNVAYNCFYHLERKDRDGKTSVIEGISVRMAEIIAACWGNLRVQSRIIGNDGRMITAQGICHDLESNVAISVEVKRSIMGKYGTYSQDMQVVTGNAASAIALRNAICKVVPAVLIKSVVDAVQCKALEHINKEGTTSVWLKWVEFMQQLGINEQQLLLYVHKDSRDAITAEDVQKLAGVYNAIQEGTTTVEETFKKPNVQAAMAEEAKASANKAKAKAEAAIKKQP